MEDTAKTQEQQQGNFVANMVKPRVGRNGKIGPNVLGRITAPGSKRERSISLWSNEYRDAAGDMMIGMNGNVDSVSREDDPMNQLRSHTRGAAGPAVKIDRIPGKEPITLEDGKVAIFQSKNKEGEKAANGNLRTNFYGYWNDNGKIVEVGIWLHRNKDTGQAFLGGNTQYPMPGKDGPEFGTMSQDELDRRQQSAGDRNFGDNRERDDPAADKPEKPKRRASRFLEEDARSR